MTTTRRELIGRVAGLAGLAILADEMYDAGVGNVVVLG